MSQHTWHTEEDARLEEAAAWHLRVASSETPAVTRAKLEAWLASDALNRSAFEQVGAALQKVDSAAADPRVADRRRAALDRTQPPAESRVTPHMRRWSVLVSAAAVFAAVAIGVAVATAFLHPMFQSQQALQIETAPGERRVVTLEDGSKVSLDEATRLSVRYSRAARTLELLSGQARFSVARDVQRPFTVIVQDRTVTAFGTVFNIDLLDTSLFITLIEGRVRVSDATSSEAKSSSNTTYRLASPIDLEPAQQLVIASDRRVVMRSQVDIEGITAWESGKLVFDDEPLSLAVERINRYARHKLLLSDARLAALRVSGVFDTGDTQAFAEGAASYLPLVLSERATGELVLHPRN